MPERVMPRDFPKPPIFIIPLSNSELQELGTFTAIWSQIDWTIMMLIAKLAETEMANAQLLLETMTTGPRVGLLSKLCAQNPSPITSDIKKLLDANGGLIENRNQLIHGLWAVNWETPGAEARASCLYTKGKAKPIDAAKLPILSDRAASFCHELGGHLTKLIPALKLGQFPKTFLFGEGGRDGQPPPPWPPVQAE